MTITEIKDNKKRYLDLLLLADEQEDMIDRYLERGTMYILEDGGVKCECVVTDEGNGILEIKNIATAPESQRKGYAAALIDQAGLKGFQVGGAAISTKHAGFAVNLGGATAADIRSLLAQVSDLVFEKSGIRLEPEVRIW